MRVLNNYLQNCQHNTRGDFCEECSVGYRGDASRGTPYDCSPDGGKSDKFNNLYNL